MVLVEDQILEIWKYWKYVFNQNQCTVPEIITILQNNILFIEKFKKKPWFNLYMLQKIGLCDPTVVYIPGKDVPLEDCLSRLIQYGHNSDIPNIEVVLHEVLKSL